MTLREDLKDIQGVGDATADSILDVFAEHNADVDVEKALYFLERGNIDAAKSVLDPDS